MRKLLLALTATLGFAGVACGESTETATTTATEVAAPGTTTTTNGQYVDPMKAVLDVFVTDADRIVETESRIAARANAGDLDGVVAGCRQLATDVTVAESHLPFPIPEVNAPYSEALRYLGLAADACIAGDFDGAVFYIELSSRYLDDATSAIGSYIA